MAEPAILNLVLWIGGIGCGVLLLHMLATWAEGRGWIYYRTSGGRGAAFSNAMAEFDAVVSPAVEHAIEERRSQAIRRAETGAGLGIRHHPPGPGHSSGIKP